MALKNTQYDEIMREYYRKQTEDRHEQEERTRRATEALPELTAIDHEIASLSVSSARKALEGDETNAQTEEHHRQSIHPKMYPRNQ